MKKQLKLAAFAALLAVGFTANAQITDATNTDLNKDKGRKAGGSADDEKSIRLIDNKGTIKYIQAKNGLTQITSEVSGNRTVTTWQLGGVLNDNTYIKAKGESTAGAGDEAEFALDGLKLVGPRLTQAEYDALPAADKTPENQLRIVSTNATDRSDHGTGTGFTVLIRDEATGAVQKMLLGSLLDIRGVRVDYNQTADATSNVTIPVDGLPTLDALSSAAKLFVYRNGAKLRFGTDFTVTAGNVIITYDANELPMYQDDKIEIQYIK